MIDEKLEKRYESWSRLRSHICLRHLRRHCRYQTMQGRLILYYRLDQLRPSSSYILTPRWLEQWGPLHCVCLPRDGNAEAVILLLILSLMRCCEPHHRSS